MAVIALTKINPPPGNGNSRIVMVQWGPLANGDSGEPLDLGAFAERTVQLRGTPGVGGNCRIEGSLFAAPAADADWDALTDPQGNALDVTTAARLEAVSEATRWIRPRVTGGDGTTSYIVRLFAVLK